MIELGFALYEFILSFDFFHVLLQMMAKVTGQFAFLLGGKLAVHGQVCIFSTPKKTTAINAS